MSIGRVGHMGAVAVAAVAVVTLIFEAWIGPFPVELFRFPLNVLTMALWLLALGYLYRNRTTSTTAQLLLSREATYLSLFILATTGIALGLEFKPSTDAWPVVIGLLFVLSHTVLVVLRGWRNGNGIRWRFTITHLGLLLALGAGFWGAPDREQLRVAATSEPTNEAFTMSGVLRTLPYDIALADSRIELSATGSPMLYEATIRVEGQNHTLRVNHPYDRTIAEKIYLISFGTTTTGERYAIIEIVREPWQWITASGIVMLIAGAVLLFARGPRRKYNDDNQKIKQ